MKLDVAADLISCQHIDFGEKRKNQFSNLGIFHSMVISIQVKNSIIYIVIIHYPKKIT